jgi:hypothetical protein
MTLIKYIPNVAAKRIAQNSGRRTTEIGRIIGARRKIMVSYTCGEY